MKYNPKSTAIPEIIPGVLICTAGIILVGRMHLYPAFLFHRDYFDRSNASLSCSFAPQGLFPPAKCISISLFCSTGIISTSRMHLYLAFLFHRDYFHRPDASLSSSFAPQGLFCPGRIHLYLALLFHRDYFAPAGCISILLFCSTGIILLRSDASLSSSFASQGLFPPAGCISIFLFCFTGIISASRMHLYLAFFFHRDYFRWPNTSLSSSFVPQGLFRPTRCISIFLFCSTGIISSGRMHLYLPLLSHRDYFRQSDSSLPSSFVPQGLFLPPGCIPSLLFFHRDYFHRSDSSPACSFLPQGLFRPAECISNPGSCKVSATKLLLHRKHSYGFC